MIIKKNGTSNYELFVENVKNFCIDYITENDCYDYAEDEELLLFDFIEEGLENLEFDPVALFDFKPLFTYEAVGDFFMSPNFRDDKIFKQNACMLYCNDGTFTSAGFDVFNTFEVWLLEDMSIKTAFSYEIRMETIGKFVSTYRIATNEFKGEFDLEDFIESLSEKIFNNGHVKYNHIELV